MNTFTFARALRGALIAIAVISSAGIAQADINDYEFNRVDPMVAVGKDKIVTVQLVNKKTGKLVPDAVIFATRLDFAPDGMAEMTTGIVGELGGEPGMVESKLVGAAQK